MALILGIETSSKNCSVSLIQDGEVVAAKESAAGYQHSEKLHVFIQNIFEESSFDLSDLDALMLGEGPGSFTGLRIGTSAAKGFCFALSIPLMAYSSLANMALQVNKNLLDTKVTSPYVLCSLIDARRMEVYAAIYDQDVNEIQKPEAMIVDEGSFNTYLKQGDVYFFGDGMNKLKPLIERNENAHFIEEVLPSSLVLKDIAEHTFKLNKFKDTAYYEPFYLKGVHLTTPKKQL